MASNKEFSREAVEAFRRFCKKADFYAVAFKFGDKRDPRPHVEYKLFTGDGLWRLFKNPKASAFFSESKGNLRFNVVDLMRGKYKAIPRAEIFADVIESIRFEGVFEDLFPRANNGTGDRSKAQEDAIATILNAMKFAGQSWQAVGHAKALNKRNWQPDIVGDAGLTVEVKGDNSDLRISYESNAEKFGF